MTAEQMWMNILEIVINHNQHPNWVIWTSWDDYLVLRNVLPAYQSDTMSFTDLCLFWWHIRSLKNSEVPKGSIHVFPRGTDDQGKIVRLDW